jgi:sugar phosphate isomerase/epimerase
MSTLELGISTLPWYYDEQLMPYLELLAPAGIRHIELRRLTPHIDLSRPRAAERFSERCRDLGLHIHSVHMPVELAHGMAEVDVALRRDSVRQAKHIAEIVCRMGAKMLVTHAGGRIPEGTPRSIVEAASFESLTSLCAFCATLGLPVALENTLPVEFGSVAEAITFQRKLAPYGVGCCLDTSHANLTGDVAEAVDVLGQKLLTLHVSDNNGTRDEHALPFDGTIDWRSFMAALDRINYAGVFMMEVRGTTDYKHTVEQIAARFDRLMACRPEQ